MTRRIERLRYQSTDPRLARHVHHDSQSRRYALDTAGMTVTSVRWPRHVPVFDQGQVGSCTAEAGIGCLGTGGYYAGVADRIGAVYGWDQASVYRFYSDEEVADGAGPYPPTDQGSTGLTCAKVLTAKGLISGYQHTFSLTDALRALSVGPVIAGTEWRRDMFDPDPDGRLRITGAVAGGHEYVVDEVDVVGSRVWITNSWGAGWGVQGRAWLTFADWDLLLSAQGDVTVFVPVTAPPPVPADPDKVLAGALRAHDWVHRPHIAGNAAVAAAGRAWLAVHGY